MHKFAEPDNSYRPKSRNFDKSPKNSDSNYSAESPKNYLVASPCDSGVSSIESSPISSKNQTGGTTPTPTGQTTPNQLDSDNTPPPVPRDIPFENPKSESKFNVPAPKDPRRVRARNWASSPKSLANLSKNSPFRSPTPCSTSFTAPPPPFSPYNARSPAASLTRSPAAHIYLDPNLSPMSCSSPISSTSKITGQSHGHSHGQSHGTHHTISLLEFKLPSFAKSPQVIKRFAMMRQVSGYKRSFTIDPMFASEYYDDTLRKKLKTEVVPLSSKIQQQKLTAKINKK